MLPKSYYKHASSLIVILIILFFSNSSITSLGRAPLQALLSPTLSPKVTTTTPMQVVTVLRVVDGDTIVIEGNKKLRYIGINAPESVDPRRPMQCFGKNASERNKALVEGKTVSIEKDVSETDKYGRLLRYVYLNGIMINEQLVKEGYAHASSYPPDIKHQERLKQAEADAKAKNLGLWASCNTN